MWVEVNEYISFSDVTKNTVQEDNAVDAKHSEDIVRVCWEKQMLFSNLFFCSSRLKHNYIISPFLSLPQISYIPLLDLFKCVCHTHI